MSTRCLTVTEVAALLGVSDDTVYRLAASREIESVKLRRRVLIPEPAYEKFVAAGGTAA